MAPIWIIMLTSIAAVLRSAAYGVYEWQQKNKCGAAGLFVISAACFGVVILTLTSILTNL